MKNISGTLLKHLAMITLLYVYFVHGVSKRQRASQGYRLPDNLIPKTYNLKILTNLEENNFNFEGEVRIKVSVKQ